MSNKNRTLVCAAISAMLNNPDASGIYPTTQCYDVLERLLDDKDAQEQLAKKESDRQYHMNAINRLARFLAISGTSDNMIEAAMDNMKRFARELATIDAPAASVTEAQIAAIAEGLSGDDSAIADIKRACREVLALAGVRVI